MPGPTDCALVVPISALKPELLTHKLRVAGRVQAYDSMNGIIIIKDGETDDELLVDVSLCLTPFKTYPWLQERNTAVMAVGYLEAYDGEVESYRKPSMILRAILLKERDELDLKLWSEAIKQANETYASVKSSPVTS
ncbi:hypothetical protein NM688_g2849 [Phlebia brevispora]|uniref:Uncharacterized protein n=1 Tax=Phlebia brevispora TaxID=194682 RepID=A0ACC1T7B6_9APHY|nr:hypothetical protein NM688_g2849 [Phlebia brevispora]